MGGLYFPEHECVKYVEDVPVAGIEGDCVTVRHVIKDEFIYFQSIKMSVRMYSFLFIQMYYNYVYTILRPMKNKTVQTRHK